MKSECREAPIEMPRLENEMATIVNKRALPSLQEDALLIHYFASGIDASSRLKWRSEKLSDDADTRKRWRDTYIHAILLYVYARPSKTKQQKRR